MINYQFKHCNLFHNKKVILNSQIHWKIDTLFTAKIYSIFNSKENNLSKQVYSFIYILLLFHYSFREYIHTAVR